MLGLTCWRCEQPGHTAAECDRPAAEDELELKDRFAKYIELVRANRITLAAKRQWVTAEWAAYHKAQAAKREKAGK